MILFIAIMAAGEIGLFMGLQGGNIPSVIAGALFIFFGAFGAIFCDRCTKAEINKLKRYIRINNNNSGSGICLMFNSYEQAYEAYNAETCPYAEPKMTNFDRIKAMSIEELAKLLCYCSDCGNGRCYGDKLCTYGDDACNGLVKWLESEVQEE